MKSSFAIPLLILISSLFYYFEGGQGETRNPLVATHYFYWYHWPSEHFNEPGAPGTEGHLHHFPMPENVSYQKTEWHEKQFRDMEACGIDFALPVYWGAPMAEALDRIQKNGGRGVKLGLMYDTTTLLNDVRGAEPRGGKPDLTSEQGRALFCNTVVEYFESVPPKHWARVDGGALVALYASAFAKKWDSSLGPSLRDAFARRFDGEKVFLVADQSWGEIGQDRTTSWGAALEGPKIYPKMAEIGAGYDDSAVPNRSTPVREREDGAFYTHSWREAIQSGASLIFIETWNEMHEGTEICETKETGRTYLDLTKKWIALARIPKTERGLLPAEIKLKYKDPRSRPDFSSGAVRLIADYSKNTPVRSGLREIPWDDGPIEIRDGAVRSSAPQKLSLQMQNSPTAKTAAPTSES